MGLKKFMKLLIVLDREKRSSPHKKNLMLEFYQTGISEMELMDVCIYLIFFKLTFWTLDLKKKRNVKKNKMESLSGKTGRSFL